MQRMVKKEGCQKTLQLINPKDPTDPDKLPFGRRTQKAIHDDDDEEES